MKNCILIWVLVAALLASGCAATKTETPQTTDGSTVATTTETTEASQDVTEEQTTASTESTPPETTETPADDDHDELDDYMASIKEQSDSIKKSLQEDPLCQAEMNQAAQDLYLLWDGALNELWSKLRDTLPEDEFDKLLDEQLTWIDDKEAAVEEAGQPYEGGSLYPLITNREAAQITEARVEALYQLLKQAQ